MSESAKKSNEFFLTDAQRQSSSELRWVEEFTRTLDTKLRIPGTDIRFGLDFILGLIPGVGGFLSLALSGLLIATMAKKGASLLLVTKMVGNVLLDTIVGAIPIVGNLFDLFYKANVRNIKLMREYYDEDKHRGSAWPILIPLLLTFLAIFGVWLAFLFWIANLLRSWLGGST
jgi:Domain of unknown function (DUF4112)